MNNKLIACSICACSLDQCFPMLLNAIIVDKTDNY